jgi:hypothetical protein
VYADNLDNNKEKTTADLFLDAEKTYKKYSEEQGLCKCGHKKEEHIIKEPFLGGCSHIIDGDKFYCCCAEFEPKEIL